ncbi:MAG: DNA cytosine methyltransferase [Lentisphaeria bacterium]|nr:DNA cytosine methyltransferase [Lentisphaeria bacterium]
MMFNVVDLFSGAGGMSLGFHRHPEFQLVAAADIELGKPSAGKGKLQCNTTFLKNIGLAPAPLDLSTVPPRELRRELGLAADLHIHVLSVCPPCTGFSRQNPLNHVRDDRRNSLVQRAAEFAAALAPDIVVMENARELLRGNFKHHYDSFCDCLSAHGYRVSGANHMLTKFGLPQIRERAIVVAARAGYELRVPGDLWRGMRVRETATHVRQALASITPDAPQHDLYPGFSSELVRRRLHAIPHDGGSWMSLARHADGDELMTAAMKRIVSRNRIGSYPDVYGRMAWDRPAPTIKRECAHIGNGRYAHPEEDRLCSVREMAKLQGFPDDFVFGDTAVSNMYRHIGDAVPPLISFQLAHLCHWMLTGEKSHPRRIVLPGTSLRTEDIVQHEQEEFEYASLPRRSVSRRRAQTSGVPCRAANAV